MAMAMACIWKVGSACFKNVELSRAERNLRRGVGMEKVQSDTDEKPQQQETMREKSQLQ